MDSNKLPVLNELEVEARRVLVRVNFDVPIKDGQVEDPARINAALPTINYLIDNGARVILMSHLGNPDGKFVPELSLEPIASYLAALPNIGEVFLADSCVGDGARSVIQGLREGQVCLLENLAFHSGEFKNDDKLARQLASFCDIYINEAFSVVEHRYASKCAITRHARLRTAGLQFTAETAALTRLLGKRERPFSVILGGNKIDPVLAFFEKHFESMDTLMLGGAIANTFIAARGGTVGDSLIEKDKLPLARDILERAARKEIPILVPTDSLTAEGTFDSDRIPEGQKALDIGPGTIATYKQSIAKSGTVLWLGRMGAELASDGGTVAIARAIAGSAAYSVALGDQSAAAVRKAGLEKGFSHVCAGEKAAITMLEGKNLPGLAALGGFKASN